MAKHVALPTSDTLVRERLAGVSSIITPGRGRHRAPDPEIVWMCDAYTIAGGKTHHCELKSHSSDVWHKHSVYGAWQGYRNDLDKYRRP